MLTFKYTPYDDNAAIADQNIEPFVREKLDTYREQRTDDVCHVANQYVFIEVQRQVMKDLQDPDMNTVFPDEVAFLFQGEKQNLGEIFEIEQSSQAKVEGPHVFHEICNASYSDASAMMDLMTWHMEESV